VDKMRSYIEGKCNVEYSFSKAVWLRVGQARRII